MRSCDSVHCVKSLFVNKAFIFMVRHLIETTVAVRNWVRCPLLTLWSSNLT